MEDLVTVIIPVYNVESYLAKCLDSVVNQTYQNLQIILVNDGTKDNSLEICEQYAHSDSRITIINKENGGLSSARNKGLEYAEGVYCYFLDSDDYIELDLIEKAARKMTEENADMVIFGMKRFREDSDETESFELGDRTYMLSSPKQRFEFIAREYYQYNVAYEVWNKLYKLDIIKKNNMKFEDNNIIFSEDVRMNEKNVPENVPYIVHEGDMARLERCNKRLLIALIAALVIMLLNNIAWLIYDHVESQDTQTEYISEIQP